LFWKQIEEFLVAITQNFFESIENDKMIMDGFENYYFGDGKGFK